MDLQARMLICFVLILTSVVPAARGRQSKSKPVSWSWWTDVVEPVYKLASSESKSLWNTINCNKVPAAAGAVAGVTFFAAAPAALTAAGFTSAGIAAGSWGATLMGWTASATGGGVASGSIVATLQSAGATGVGATAASAVGWTTFHITKFFQGECQNTSDNDKQKDV